jgi:spermidine/putrescine transport system permease protein
MVAPGKQATIARAERLPGVPAIRIGNVVLFAYSLLFYLFIYGPILILIVYSFNASRFPTRWGGFSLEWYQKLFQNRAMGQALRNSLIISFSSTAISTVIGTMVSVAIERYRFRGKTPLDAMLFLPIIIPDIAMAIMLVAFFGLINMPLGFATIIISHVAFNISFVAIVVRSRMTTIDPTLEEAANDLYANEWQAFWRITFPLLLPGILGGALLAFTLSLDDYVITFFTSGPGSTTLPLRIYGMVKTGITPEVNAISTLMMAASLALVILSLWIQGKGEAMG